MGTNKYRVTFPVFLASTTKMLVFYINCVTVRLFIGTTRTPSKRAHLLFKESCGENTVNLAMLIYNVRHVTSSRSTLNDGPVAVRRIIVSMFADRHTRRHHLWQRHCTIWRPVRAHVVHAALDRTRDLIIPMSSSRRIGKSRDCVRSRGESQGEAKIVVTSDVKYAYF